MHSYRGYFYLLLNRLRWEKTSPPVWPHRSLYNFHNHQLTKVKSHVIASPFLQENWKISDSLRWMCVDSAAPSWHRYGGLRRVSPSVIPLASLLSLGAIFGFTFVMLFPQKCKNTNCLVLQRSGGSFTTGTNSEASPSSVNLREIKSGFNWGRSLFSV
jgi:hypothetical protein